MIELADYKTIYDNYPLNLLDRESKYSTGLLKRWHARLASDGGNLCLDDEKQVELPIRDIFQDSSMKKTNIHTEAMLESWLGPDGKDPSDVLTVSKTSTSQGPKCRFVYLYGEHSRDYLRVTRRMLKQILTRYQVTPLYLDYIFLFGSQSDAKDLRFSSFREEIDPYYSGNVASDPQSPKLQICYNLKGVTLTNGHEPDPRLQQWSVRQAAIYLRYDLCEGDAVWIVTKGGLDLQQRFKEMTGRESKRLSFGNTQNRLRSSLTVHSMFMAWAQEDWLEYVRWLESVFTQETEMAILSPRITSSTHRRYNVEAIQNLQQWKDKVNEAIMMLKSNMEIMNAIRDFYKRNASNVDFPQAFTTYSQRPIRMFEIEVEQATREQSMILSRFELLETMSADRKDLILEHLQGQAAERTERLTINMEKEAIVMRIVTIVTLIYLPATFVSTFFGTDVVRYNENRGQSSETSFSSVALTRWLQVTLPLTFITILGAWVTYKAAERGKQQSVPEATQRPKQSDHRRIRQWFPRNNVAPRKKTEPFVLPLSQYSKSAEV